MPKASRFMLHTGAALCAFLILNWPGVSRGASSPCLAPHISGAHDGFRYAFPPAVEKEGLTFAGHSVPLKRKDIRRRVLQEINHLLLDRRSRVVLWLSRADEFGPVVAPILSSYEVPPEFLLLPAIESSYNARAKSSAGAYGYWQFISKTAETGCPKCGQLDWKMSLLKWRDDRADLHTSTQAAARYLAYLNRNQRVSIAEKSEREGFNDWLLTAAAYNAGPKRVTDLMNAFITSNYWDTPLPYETERYVPRLIAIWLIHKHRDFYGVRIPTVRALSYETVEHVKLEKELSLTAMAKLIGATPRKLWALNTSIFPEYAAFPAKNGKTKIEHQLHVPRGTKAKLINQLTANGYMKKQ